MKTINHLRLLILILAVGLSACNPVQKQWELKSPGGNLSLVIHSEKAGQDVLNQISYQLFISKDGASIEALSKSPLGITRQDADFSKNLDFLQSSMQKNVKMEYELVSGKQRLCKNEYNELVLEFQTADQQPVNFVFRAFNNGIAFCYEFPVAGSRSVRILGEKSGFSIPGATAWIHAYDTVTKYTPAYETFYQGPMPSGSPADKGKNGWAFPALFETSQNQWILISESGLDGNYVASHLDISGGEGLYVIKNPVETEAMGFFEATSYTQLPFRTPWRVVIAGNELSTVVESNLITDLAPANKLENTGWIRPGRAGWSWWYDNDSPKDYNRMLPFIDFAARMGWEYFLVDANWNFMKNGTMEKLAEYASSKNVGLILWYNSGGKHNEVSEAPRDLMDNREIRRREFQRIHELGVKGVKVDFFQSDKEEIIRQYIDILEDAAEFEVMVNFHGCTLPKGWSRTYPNLVSTEAVRGAESYLFDPLYPEKAPSHLAIVPFTRGVVGPTDYTPGGFSDSKYPRKTSNGFELALPVLIESGITHYVDAPSVYELMPEFVTGFLREVPVLWDEMKFLEGYPGKYAVIARRSGDKWFLAGINGQNQDQPVKIDISGISKNPSLKIITDGSEPRSLLEKEIPSVNGIVEINLGPLGGFVSVIKNE